MFSLKEKIIKKEKEGKRYSHLKSVFGEEIATYLSGTSVLNCETHDNI